jgi:hypothetical protein
MSNLGRLTVLSINSLVACWLYYFYMFKNFQPCINRMRGNSIDVCCRDPNYQVITFFLNIVF